MMFNPAPMNNQVSAYPINKVDWLIVNESEGEALTSKTSASDILHDLKLQFPKTKIVLTQGEKGLLCMDLNRQINIPAHKIEAVDTTGAGDTFIGFFLAALVQKKELKAALRGASAAAAICATRQGAASSIPDLEEVQQFMKKER